MKATAVLLTAACNLYYLCRTIMVAARPRSCNGAAVRRMKRECCGRPDVHGIRPVWRETLPGPESSAAAGPVRRRSGALGAADVPEHDSAKRAILPGRDTRVDAGIPATGTGLHAHLGPGWHPAHSGFYGRGAMRCPPF